MEFYCPKKAESIIGWLEKCCDADVLDHEDLVRWRGEIEKAVCSVKGSVYKKNGIELIKYFNNRLLSRKPI
jgi:hypothetical protein